MKKIVLSLLLTAAAFSATAQDFIGAPQEIKDSRSVVREVNKGIWLTANYYDGNQMGCFFLNDANPSPTNYYDAGYLVVHDLEVLNEQTAFYCGERYNYRCYQIGQKDSGFVPEDTLYTIVSYDTMGNYVYVKRVCAVMGYFQMNLDSLFLYNFHEITNFQQILFRCFDKLELLPVNDGLHVLMTGTVLQGYGCLLDAAFFPGPQIWEFNGRIAHDGTFFDDVAITDNYIVASRRNPVNDSGYIEYHDRPISITQPAVFGGYVVELKLDFTVDDTLLLEHCDKDFFATATYSQGDNGIVISGFYGTSQYGTVVLPLFPTLNPLQQLIDIKYDSTIQVLALLQHFLYMGDTSSVVWHLSPKYINAMSGNVYYGQNLFSIDRRNQNPGHIIASGHRGNENSWLINHYQHLIGSFVCSERMNTSGTYKEDKTEEHYVDYPGLHEVRPSEDCYFNRYSCAYRFLCPSNF